MALFGGDLIRMGLSFAAGILVARALGPAEFGVYAVLAAAVGIGGAVADLGLSNAGVYRVASVWQLDPELALQRGRSFFWARVGCAAAMAAAAMALARWLAPALGLPPAVGPYQSSALLTLAFAGVAATALSGAVSVLLANDAWHDRTCCCQRRPHPTPPAPSVVGRINRDGPAFLASSPRSPCSGSGKLHGSFSPRRRHGSTP
jgi:hypothetical protein